LLVAGESIAFLLHVDRWVSITDACCWMDVVDIYYCCPAAATTTSFGGLADPVMDELGQ
jgi:hypothetical protein